jgi:hypothetical protein
MTKVLKQYIKEVIIKNEEKSLMSEGLKFHINENIPISTNIYRPGSTRYFNLFTEARKLHAEGKIILEHEIDKMYIAEMEIGEFGVYEGQIVPLDYPIMEGNEEHLNEAIYKGKKVKLDKPKRSGKGRAYVYVNSGKKTKDGQIKAKKVSFGSDMPKAMGKSEAHRKRRKSFGDRHNCSAKKDKTKAGWWSCRLTKLFGRNIPGWW